MDKIMDVVLAVFVGGFGYLTARVTKSTKKDEYSATMSQRTFDELMKRVTETEEEVKELREFKSDYRELKVKYDELKEDYDRLKIESNRLKSKIEILERGSNV